MDDNNPMVVMMTVVVVVMPMVMVMPVRGNWRCTGVGSGNQKSQYENERQTAR